MSIIHEPWTLAKGGRSVNAGRFGKIRMEPGVPEDQLKAAMRLVAAAPKLLKAVDAALHQYVKREWTDPASGGPAKLLIEALEAAGRGLPA